MKNEIAFNLGKFAECKTRACAQNRITTINVIEISWIARLEKWAGKRRTEKTELLSRNRTQSIWMAHAIDSSNRKIYWKVTSNKRIVKAGKLWSTVGGDHTSDNAPGSRRWMPFILRTAQQNGRTERCAMTNWQQLNAITLNWHANTQRMRVQMVKGKLPRKWGRRKPRTSSHLCKKVGGDEKRKRKREGEREQKNDSGRSIQSTALHIHTTDTKIVLYTMDALRKRNSLLFKDGRSSE